LVANRESLCKFLCVGGDNGFSAHVRYAVARPSIVSNVRAPYSAG